MCVPGASRYRSSGSSAPSAPQSSYMDPYTGASRYSGAPQPPPPAAKILPVVSHSDHSRFPPPFNSATQGKYITFKQASVSAMQGKLHQFDEALQHEIVSYHMLLPFQICWRLLVHLLSRDVSRRSKENWWDFRLPYRSDSFATSDPVCFFDGRTCGINHSNSRTVAVLTTIPRYESYMQINGH